MLWSAVARASVTSVAKKAVPGLFCFGRASKNFRSRKAQKFWSVVIFASFAPVDKTIPSAARCASFEPVKTKLRSADTCTSAASVAKTFSRAMHQKKRSVVTSFSLALVRKKIGRWTLLLQSCQSQNAKVVIRARRETLMSAVTRASFTSVAVKLLSADTFDSFALFVKIFGRSRRENTSVGGNSCFGHLSRKKIAVGGHLCFGRASRKKNRSR